MASCGSSAELRSLHNPQNAEEIAQGVVLRIDGLCSENPKGLENKVILRPTTRNTWTVY